MKTIRTKVYKFNELNNDAKNKALEGQIEFEILVMNEESPYWYLAEEMERMQTPWFLGAVIYEKHLKDLIATIEANEYDFTKDGKLFHA